MGSKRELEPDHDVQPVGKKRKKVKAMMAAAQVAIAEVSAKLKRKKKLKKPEKTGEAPAENGAAAPAAELEQEAPLKAVKKVKKEKKGAVVTAAEAPTLEAGGGDNDAAALNGVQQKKIKKRKVKNGSVTATVQSAVEDGGDAARPLLKVNSKKKAAKLQAAELDAAAALAAADGDVADGQQNAARINGDASAVPGKEGKKKKKKAKQAETEAEPGDAVPNGEPAPPEGNQRSKPEPDLEAAVPDPEDLKDDASPQKRGTQRQQQQQEGGPGSGRAFQRVKAEEWLNKKAARDNSYVGTFGEAGYGIKAQQVLGQVRGKDFRHEKTKKKRGSYRGGIIDHATVNSFKFDSDDE